MPKRKKPPQEICCKDCHYISFKEMYGVCDNPLSPFFCNRPVRPWDSCPCGKLKNKEGEN